MRNFRRGITNRCYFYTTPMSRIDDINRYFLDVALTHETMDVYTPRKAIFAAVKECTPLLSGSLLDIGCGQMPYREVMLASNRNITKYTGLDLQSSSVHDTSIADLHWDAETIPAENNSFDSAMATEVLEHSFAPQRTLAEINRILKPGGTFFFTVPFLWPLHETPYDAYRYTPYSLKMHLEATGFENINIRSLGGWHTSFAQMLGLWVKESNLQGYRKRLAVKLACKLIPYLLKNDVKDNRFGHHCMISGLYGTATKKLVP